MTQSAFRHHSTADNAERPAELDVGSLHLDLAHYEATFGGRPLDLTPSLQSDPAVGYRLSAPGAVTRP